MNSSKKIMSQDETKTVTVNVPEKKQKRGGSFSGGSKKPVILGALCVIIAVTLCVGVVIQQTKPTVLVKVGDTKLTMDDMIYPIYEVESMYLPYDEMYQAQLGYSVWEAQYQGDSSLSGVTNSVGLKQQVLNTEVEYEILYQLAKKADYKLSAEDKKEVEKKVEEAMKGLSWMQKLRLNITKSKLTDRFEKRALADKYEEDKRAELNKEIDEAETIKDISKKDYRQYDIQYYSAALTSYDDEGNAVTASDEEKAELKKKIEQIAKKAKSADDFTKLGSEDDEDVTFTEDGSFTKQDGWSLVSKKNLKTIKSMKNGEVSEAFIDDETGYYVVVKMVDNNSEEAYETACDSAITEAQTAAYTEWYSEIQEKDFEVSVKDAWTDITMGAVTTDIVTAEDLQDMQEDSSESEENGSDE